MTCVIVNDASCLIDLRKGGLLGVVCDLPYRFVIPLPVRASEVPGVPEAEWQALDEAGHGPGTALREAHTRRCFPSATTGPPAMRGTRRRNSASLRPEIPQAEGDRTERPDADGIVVLRRGDQHPLPSRSSNASSVWSVGSTSQRCRTSSRA